MIKKRILYLSSIALEPTTGGYLLMYRHLKMREDFEVFEVNHQVIEAYRQKSTIYKLFDPFVTRLRRTRLSIWLLNLLYLNYDRQIPDNLLKDIRQFQPNVVLTVVHGNLFWSALQISQQMNLPLVSIYHDWWPLLAEQFINLNFRSVQKLHTLFRKIYAKSNCVFSVCQGMQEELGEHPNSHILYPIPSDPPAGLTEPYGSFNEDVVLELPSLCYAGNLSSGYGLLLRNVLSLTNCKLPFQLDLYGSVEDWPNLEREAAKKTGVLKPYTPFHQLVSVFGKASALLTVMSFEKESELFLRTSFPSKFTAYCAFGKPLVVWAPAVSSIASFVKKHKAALLIEDPNPLIFIQKVEELFNSQSLQEELTQRAKQLYEELFHPDRIHQKFVEQILSLC